MQKKFEEERAARQLLEQQVMELQKAHAAVVQPTTPLSNQQLSSPHVSVQKRTENVPQVTPQLLSGSSVAGINGLRYAELSNFAQQLALADQNAALIRQNLILQNALLGNNSS